MKKLSAIILSIALVLSLVVLPGTVVASAKETDGYYYYEVSDGEAKIVDVSASISGAVTIPSTLGGYPVTSIGNGAFRDCNGLTSVTIGNSVTSIGNCAFDSCVGLKRVTIPNSVTSIGREAFFSCFGLTSVTIPKSVTSIGYRAFADCIGLESIIVNSGNSVYRSENNCIIEKATNKLIHGCNNSIIPSGVTSIGDYAFDGFHGLTEVTIPDSVTSIGDYAFSCQELESVTIGKSVTSIGNRVFYGCQELARIIVDSGNSVYRSENNCIIEKATNKLILGCNYSIIPSSVTSIGDYAFYDCDKLTSVTIGKSVTSIGDYAFYYCHKLTSVTIPHSVTSIGDYAFYSCAGLKSVTIPKSVTSIGYRAFAVCSNLADVYYTGTKTQWDDLMTQFGENNSALQKATVHCNYVPSHVHNYFAVVVAPTCTNEGYTIHTCAVCGDNYKGSYVSALGHTYDNACDTTCNVCGEMRTNAHDYQLKTGDGFHYEECSLCFDVRNMEVHIYDNDCDTTCNVCGYERAITHQYKTVWSADGTEHWHECKICGNKTEVAEHSYDNDCDTTCNVCGYERAITHQYKTVWSADGTEHWHECKICGNKTAVAEHCYDNDCDTTCNICGYVREVKPHDYKWVLVSGNNGHRQVCSICGAYGTLGMHNYTDDVCTVCGYNRIWNAFVSDFNEGWNSTDGKVCYVKNGELLTGLQNIGKKLYFFDENGVQCYGFKEIDGKYYYFQNLKYGGAAYYGKVAHGGKIYNTSVNGYALYPEGWTSDKTSYIENGVKVTGIKTIGNKTYFFDADGVQSSGFQVVDGKYYYFNSLKYGGTLYKGKVSSNGKVYDTSVLGYAEAPEGWNADKTSYVENGVKAVGLKKIGKLTYFFDENGEMSTGFKMIDGTAYFFVAKSYGGYAYTGKVSYGGKVYTVKGL